MWYKNMNFSWGGGGGGGDVCWEGEKGETYQNMNSSGLFY